jgi:MoaA/NifB/PqqE/SkfB family radical SAM enzyme/SAM-dependent methyltransferase
VKALIKVGYGCNDRCSFCHTEDVRHIDGAAEEVHRKIERAKELGHAMVVLSGGEPTIRPELKEWAAHVASLDMDFGLVTNGRMLAYADVVEALIASRLKYVYLSIHGGTPKIHNLLVRTNAFTETYGALANLTGRGIDLTANCVVTEHNVDHLRPLVDALLPYPDAKLKFSMVEPKGGARHLFEHLVPRVGHVAAKVRDAIEYGLSKAPDGPRFLHGGIPLCLMSGLEDRFDDLKTHRYRTMIEIGEPDFFPVDDGNKLQPAETCTGCALRGPCPGLYREYHAMFGSAELAPPTPAPQSNAFNFVFEERFADAERCVLLDRGVTPWDRGRHLFVRHGGKVARYRAETRDFPDDEIAFVKHDHGQVYADLGKGEPFPRGLVKLGRSSMCTDCSEREACTGMFEPVFDDPFARDDAMIRALLASLEGDVLDLGCGDASYLGALEGNAQRGALRYVGVDPDAAKIAELRARAPWARLEIGDAEDFSMPSASFDHVLLLRSWNHLRDPLRVIEAAERALRPRGTLTIADDVVFALARGNRSTAKAERSTRFEHLRADSAADAMRRLEGRGLRLVERRDAGPATSTTWLLRYERADRPMAREVREANR